MIVPITLFKVFLTPLTGTRPKLPRAEELFFQFLTDGKALLSTKFASLETCMAQQPSAVATDSVSHGNLPNAAAASAAKLSPAKPRNPAFQAMGIVLIPK